jgi:ribonuclease BN (tRNA processing enzyme)
MRLTVLGGRGAWPDAGQACSGYLVEHEGFRLLIDPGYAIVPRLVSLIDADQLDAVYVSHGHPDHCADLNPLLRARALRDDPAAALPVYAPADSLTAVLALDRPGMLDNAYTLHEFTPGDSLHIGPFDAETRLLPHFRPNAGIRLTAGGDTLVYTGDTGPSPELPKLAHEAAVLLCEASYEYEVPEDSRTALFSARLAGELAAEAGVGRLLLTHLMPGTDANAALSAAADHFTGPTEIATAGVTREMP